MSKISNKLEKIAHLSLLSTGRPDLFKRLIRASVILAKTDTISILQDALNADIESGDYPNEDISDDEESEEPNEEDEDEDTEAGIPMGALPHKERKQGPHPKDVGLAKPDWWNP